MIDPEYLRKIYTIEYCPNCDSEQVIYTKGITACPNCGFPLAPCSCCSECDYNTCPYGCSGTYKDKYKKITNPIISKDEAQRLYQYL